MGSAMGRARPLVAALVALLRRWVKGLRAPGGSSTMAGTRAASQQPWQKRGWQALL